MVVTVNAPAVLNLINLLNCFRERVGFGRGSCNESSKSIWICRRVTLH